MRLDTASMPPSIMKKLVMSVECGLDEETVKIAVLKVIAGRSSSHLGV